MSTTYDTQDPGMYEVDNPPPTPNRLRKVLRQERQQLGEIHELLAEAEIPPVTERAANGRFLKGNKGGTGNPFARQVAGLRQALLDTVTAQDMADVAAALLEKAKSGNVAAMKLFFSYVLGKPTATPDPDRLELEDYELLKARLSPLREDWDKVRDRVPVEAVVAAGHEVADLRAANWQEQVHRHKPAKPATPPPAAAPAAAPEPVLPRHTGKTEESLKEASQARMLPSPNGTNGAAAPSANGSTAANAPSPNGFTAATLPSRNGRDGGAADGNKANGQTS